MSILGVYGGNTVISFSEIEIPFVDLSYRFISEVTKSHPKSDDNIKFSID